MRVTRELRRCKGEAMTDTPLTSASLRRNIAILGAVLLTVSAITPASSVFIIIPGVISQAGTGVVACLLIAAFIGIIIALVYGELASSYPSAGGEYVIVSKVLGLLPAYVTLVLNASIMTLISAVLASGAGDYFGIILPTIPPRITAIIIVIFATLLGVMNIRLNAWVTGLFLLLEVICIGVVVWLSASNVEQPLDILRYPVFLGQGDSSLKVTSIAMIMVATATAAFAFNGYEQAIYLTEEIRDVRRNIARIVMLSLIFTLILEFTPTVLMLLSSHDLPATLSSPSPFLDMVTRLGGPGATKFVAAGIVVAVLNACIVNILMTGRFLYSTARDGFWGRSLGRRLSAISLSQGTPWIATVIVGSMSAIACLVPLNFLLVLTGTGLIAIYLLLCIVNIVARVKGRTSDNAFRAPFFPLLPIVGAIALAGIIVANWQDRTLGRPSLIWTLIVIGFGTALYLTVRYVRKDAPLEIVLAME